MDVQTAAAPERCPIHGKLLDHNRKCWFCQKTPEEAMVEIEAAQGATEEALGELLDEVSEEMRGRMVIQQENGPDLPFNEETGEVMDPPPAAGSQLSLDARLFDTFKVPEVKINVSGGVVVDRKEIHGLVLGKLSPGCPVQLIVNGYVAGAGVKWSPGGEGKAGGLNITIDKIKAIEVTSAPS